MEKIAIIGFGNHVIKNILPALLNISEVSIEAIYVRDPDKYVVQSEKYGIAVKSTYAIDETKASWIYICTPISSHYKYARQALALRKNVICEKPVSENSKQTQELYQLAKSSGLHFVEMCMYKYHSQYKYLEKLVAEIYDDIKSVRTQFKIPHLSENDIRYQRSLGGGALLDVGYYPISIIVNLFGIPNGLSKVIKTEPTYTVDLFGSALMDYDNFYCTANWAIGAPYSNDLVIETTDTRYIFERAFSKPPHLETVLTKNKEGVIERIVIEGDDHFGNFFKAAINNQVNDCGDKISSVLDKVMN